MAKQKRKQQRVEPDDEPASERPRRRAKAARERESGLAALLHAYTDADPRALGAFRVAFGLLMIADLLRHLPGLAAWFGPDAVASPADIAAIEGPATPYSLYLFTTSLPLVGVIMAASFAVFVAYTVGYKTRLAQVLAVVAIVSLHGRNDFIEHAGERTVNILAVLTAPSCRSAAPPPRYSVVVSNRRARAMPRRRRRPARHDAGALGGVHGAPPPVRRRVRARLVGEDRPRLDRRHGAHRCDGAHDRDAHRHRAAGLAAARGHAHPVRLDAVLRGRARAVARHPVCGRARDRVRPDGGAARGHRDVHGARRLPAEHDRRRGAVRPRVRVRSGGAVGPARGARGSGGAGARAVRGAPGCAASQSDPLVGRVDARGGRHRPRPRALPARARRQPQDAARAEGRRARSHERRGSRSSASASSRRGTTTAIPACRTGSWSSTR